MHANVCRVRMYVPLCAAYSDIESHFSYWFKNNRGQEIGDTHLYTYIDCDCDGDCYVMSVRLQVMIIVVKDK